MAVVRTPRIAGSKIKTVRLDKIRIDGGTQSRIELDRDVIYDYMKLMREKVEFPPVLVAFDGSSYWLIDGFHRRWAASKVGIKRLRCQVVQGTRDDARWMSYGANKDHGLRRTNQDKQKAVIAAIKHPSGINKSDVQIAEHVGVSPNTVLKYRRELEMTSQIAKSDTRVGRDGRTINTASIGKTQAKPSTLEYTEKPEDGGNGKSTTSKEPTPFDHLQYWWKKADATQQCLFRNWIDGKL